MRLIRGGFIGFASLGNHLVLSAAKALPSPHVAQSVNLLNSMYQQGTRLGNYMTILLIPQPKPESQTGWQIFLRWV